MIYIITKGSYSEYHICAATTDKDRAENLKILFSDSYDDAEIEEFEDGVSGVDESNVVRPWRVQISKHNKTGEITRYANQYTEILNPGQVFEKKIYFNSDSYNSTSLVMYTMADDEEHAIKIATDEWAKQVAEMFAI